MTDKLSINQWAEEDRPREKLMRLGAEALSNAELISVYLLIMGAIILTAIISSLAITFITQEPF